MVLTSLERRFREALPALDFFCSLRFVEEQSEVLLVRQNVVQPPVQKSDRGVMITALAGGGLGYAATSDLSVAGLRSAIQRARHWAEGTSTYAAFDSRALNMPAGCGEYQTPVSKAWESVSLKEKIALLARECERLVIDKRIVDWSTFLWRTRAESLYLTTEGARIHQVQELLVPDITCTANDGAQSQTRSLGSRGASQQGGWEVLDRVGFVRRGPEIAAEALQLLEAPNCPSGTMDLVLAPSQMMLQIHESIGHPLELDRILGDERNYAGTTFVTLDMIGSYHYGSSLLNVTYDPTRSTEFATYGFDDDGSPAQRVFIIKDGILQRALGGVVSQHRAGLNGVANARACSWNRPPIDRMANLNVEPGSASFEDLIGSVEHGVYMDTNCSWSIDDSRNKFQFGCEWARVIKEGQLGHVVKNPNYRGISATFWRNLAGVGNESTLEVLGSPDCGKGEPNQAIRVGHASPACRFSGVAVFGGE